MALAPYITKATKNPANGRWSGEVSYNGDVIASVLLNADQEFKNENQFDAWAISEAHAHKASISPEARHTVVKELPL